MTEKEEEKMEWMEDKEKDTQTLDILAKRRPKALRVNMRKGREREEETGATSGGQVPSSYMMDKGEMLKE